MINRLMVRSDDKSGRSKYRQLMHLRLSQIYDIDEERDPDEDEPFSDLRIELDLRPTTSSYLTVDSRVAAHGDRQFNRFKGTAGIKDKVGNKLSLEYVYRDDELENLRTDYITGKLDTSILKPVYLHLEERYSFEKNRELETVAQVEYRSQCWSIFVTYRDRLEDQELFVSFSLAGLRPVSVFSSAFGDDEED